MKKNATLLAIAGSDPSGGAGIQADLKTMTSIGVYGATAITALTVQNASGVQSIQSLPADFVKAQIEAVFADHFVSHIKIGMLATLPIIKAVAKQLDNYSGSVIYDPVLVASTGKQLTSKKAAKNIYSHLLPYVSYLTPNRLELEYLTRKKIKNQADAIQSAQKLLATLPSMEGIIVKGGHFGNKQSTISDFLILHNGKLVESKRKRISNSNLHGTGCTHSSAFASYLLLNNSSKKAFLLAGAYMEKLILQGKKVQLSNSNTNGPLSHHLL